MFLAKEEQNIFAVITDSHNNTKPPTILCTYHIMSLLIKGPLGFVVIPHWKVEPRHEKTCILHMQKENAQISYAVKAQLISAFVFAS